MIKNVDLSIIIVNFNTKDFLRECLFSIDKSLQKSKLRFEVIIVDNGSSDGSVGIIKKSIEEHSHKFLGLTLRLIENQTNLGFSRANNQGIKVAKGKYILLLNADTLVPKETLPFMVDFMEKNKEVGVATCRVELLSGELDDACHRGFPTPWNALCHFLGLGRLFPQSNFFNGYHLGYQNLNKIHEIDACVGAFFMMRRKAGEEVNWLDEDYFWYGEDLDFCFRVKKRGWDIIFVPDVKIIHHKGMASGIKKNSSSISKAGRKTRILATNSRFDVMKIFYNKHYQTKYSRLLRWLVFGAIETKRKIALLRI